MDWEVLFHEEFYEEFMDMPEYVQDSLLVRAKLLEQFGPQLGRPHADTLKGSRFSNMKELRFEVQNEVWRVAFAFDPNRCAVFLTAGVKNRMKRKRFYKRFLNIADKRYQQYLEEL